MVKLIEVTSSAQKSYVAEIGLELTFVGLPPNPLRTGVLLLQFITFI